jgi:hypothetical protein
MKSRSSGLFVLLSVTLAFVVHGMLAHPVHSGEPKGALLGFATPRAWADKTGRFKIDARLQFADDAEVKLLKSDGRVVTVPLDKLSEPDQAFISGFLAAEKALETVNSVPSGGEENPFAGGEPGGDKSMDGPADAALPPLADGSATLEERKAITKGFRPISITPAREFWELEPPLAFPAVPFEDAIMETTLAKPFFASMRVLAAGESGTIVANSYQQGRGNRENFGRFVVASGATADVSPVFEFDQPWKLMAISADASRLAAVRVEGFDKGNDLAIFRISGGRIIPEFQFTAGGGSWDELQYAAFLPQNRLVTISQKNDLTVWDLENKIGPRAIRRGKSGGSNNAELSAAGELMAISVGAAIAMVETNAFKLVGCIMREEKAGDLAFSPDGKMLAAYEPFNVTLYDMSNGQPAKSIAVGESGASANLRWVGANLLVGSVLYDPQRGVPVWTYENRAASQTTLGEFLISGFGGDEGSTLTLFKIPHDQAIRAAADIDPDNIYSIVPGDAVAIEYQLQGVAPNVQQEIRRAVEEKIAGLKWTISPSAANTIRVSLQQGKQEEAEYYTRSGFGPVPFFAPPGFGGPRPSGPADKVRYTPWTHEITILADGKQTFQTKYVRGAPQSLSTKEGESTQAAVSRICQPSPDYFKNVAIAPYMLKEEYQGGLGKTTITASGMK